MNVRETRLASLIAHVMILVSMFFLIPYPLQLIPTSVLHGLFLYMALTSLSGNEMFERLLLLITEQVRNQKMFPIYSCHFSKPTHRLITSARSRNEKFTCSPPANFFNWSSCAPSASLRTLSSKWSSRSSVSSSSLSGNHPKLTYLKFLLSRHTLIPRLIDYKYLDALDGRHWCFRRLPVPTLPPPVFQFNK